MALTIFSIMIVLLLLGFPMMIPLIVGAFVGFYTLFGGLNQLETMIQQIMAGIRPASLIAVPMFIFAADIMTRGQSANRLIDLVMAFVGHLKGGLAVSTAAACTMFGAVSGSTQATVVAIGSPLRPRMQKAGYNDSFILALIVNASDIAFLIPPSIGMIIYGVVSNTSIAELFIDLRGPPQGADRAEIQLVGTADRRAQGAVAAWLSGDHHRRHLWGYLQPDRGGGGLCPLCADP